MATRKTHVLRPRPPWRADITRCSRHPGGLALVDPDEKMITDARDMRKWRFLADNPQFVPARVLALKMPDGMCRACWFSLGGTRGQSWTADPLGVLGLTPDDKDDASRLASELRALAALATAHPGELQRLLDAEQVLTALAAS